MSLSKISILDLDPLKHIISYLTGEKDLCSIRLTSKRFKEATDKLVEDYWNELRRVPPAGLCDIKGAVEKIDQESPLLKNNPCGLFKKLAKEFSLYGVTVSPKKLPMRIADFEVLQTQVASNYGEALIAIWSRISQQIPSTPQL